ncbi:pentatricopeptide repeat-containing protein At2g35030, mitochondrial [Cryptomeria japonica]|uniref:pentatricopeptide repeat-containing protein At2g35030, mitochondrial n=1 Tax=Cryptomeria japonica TaxID=3369 RepID=UPI0027DA33E4|nr:pentatricopeptide repeat-containing protein At2g35030, mitochondrial [Cryptomeria japonica]
MPTSPWIHNRTKIITPLYLHSVKGAANIRSKLLYRNYRYDSTNNFSLDSYSINTQVETRSRNRNFKETFSLLNTMEHPDFSSYASLLKACIKYKSLPEGKLVHAHIVQAGFACKYMYLDNTLLNMYVKCGRLIDARNLFDEMPERNVVSWSLLIAAYPKYGFYKQALTLFQQMKRSCVELDNFVFVGILPAIAGLGDLEHGREVQGDIIRSGFQSDFFVNSALVDMYAKCGSIENARQVFDKMPMRNVISFNAMISGYARNGYVVEAVKLFESMSERDVVSWTSMIVGYAQNGIVDEALELFWKMPERNVVSWNAMIGLLVQNGHFEEAVNIFEKMPVRNVVSWNTMISGFVQNGHFEEALKLFRIMPERNVVSWTALIFAYAQNGDAKKAFNIFQKMPERNVVSWNAMIAGFTQNGFLDEALKLFQKMPEPNVVTWNEMITGFALNGCFDEALELFRRMPERNVVSWTALIAGYVRNGHIDKALAIFHKMPERNVVSWNTMISGLAQNGYCFETFELFQNMQLKDVKPDSNTYASILSACANLAALSQGKLIHQDMIRNGFWRDVFMETALLTMYAKCGSIQDAHKVFDRMYVKNVASWNAIIVGCAIHGCGKEALHIFEKMRQSGTNPDNVTFVGVLSACCHAGLVNDGRLYFDCMSQHYQITPTVDHYCCMVDLLGRAGHLVEAQKFIKRMPIKPNSAVWASLLGSCRTHANVEVGKHAAEHLFRLDSNNSAHYLLLLNIYAAANRWDDVKNVRKIMEERNVKKEPACSWIEVNGKVNAFLVGGK